MKCAVRNPVTKEHHRTCRIILSRHPRQPLRIWILTVDCLGPFARRRILIFLSVDQLFARDAQFPQRHAGQINQVQRLANLDGRMHLSS
ncbi:hypothetical protein D3C84_1047740 [compost metagenome]